MSTAYDDLLAKVKEVSLLRSTAAVLGWDQETMMPPGGVEHRSLQLAQLARLAHDRFTDPRIGELLAQCEADTELTADSDGDSAVVLRETRRSYDRATKLPADLVEETARTRTIAHHHWQEAREDSDFEKFRPWLENNISLARRTAEAYGWGEGEEAWDALAEGYEPGMRARDVEAVFAPLRDRLQTLIADLVDGPRKPSTRFASISVAVDEQRAFVPTVAAKMGFDFNRGRIDISVHPFCSGTSPGDVRITTRFREDAFADALTATMHEAGHGLYEQGLLPEHTGTPLGRYASLGLHESQSRMWENFVGRSAPFWEWCLPRVKAAFGAAFDDVSPQDAYEAVNTVTPSFIRVEADEATYNMHIMVRFELERLMMSGELDAVDVPHEWNRRYKEYLGVDVPNDRLGCLQDTHWSGASFGYFPTYTLGNLYAAQLFEKILDDIPGLHDEFARGDFSSLKSWLNENIHRHGGRYLPSDLCKRVTGKELSADALLRHLERKLRPLYGV